MTSAKTDTYKVIIAGGREFANYDLLKERCEHFLSAKMASNQVVIVSGHATGADALGERFSKEHNLECLVMPADWAKNGRAAGPIRNAEMAAVADALIAFWDGKSRGTKNMIETAKLKGIPTRVVQY